MRAVKNNLPTPSGEVGELEGPRWTRAFEDRPGHPLKRETSELGGIIGSFARATRGLRRSMRGQARGSPVLVQRAVSEDPRWTRAMGDPLARPQGKRKKSGTPSMRAVKDSLAAPLRAKWENQKALARAIRASRRASGWAGKKVARSGRSISPHP